MLIDGIHIERPLDKYARRGRLRGECHFIGTALAIGLGVASAASSIGGAAIASHAAGQAADAQVSAADRAANLQHADAQAALDQNNKQFQTQQNNIAPWLTVGRSGLANLAYQLGVLPKDAVIPGTPGTPGSTMRVPSGNFNPDDSNSSDRPLDGFNNEGNGVHSGLAVRGGATFMDQAVPGTAGTADVPLSSLVNPNIGTEGSLSQDWTEKFNAPTDVTEQNDPGYQFRLQQGQDAIQRSAAARGGLLTGGTAKDLSDWTGNAASAEYGNVYNRAFNDYSTRYNTFKQNQADRYNKLAAMSGTGQTAASQLGLLGSQQAANNNTILMTSGQQIGQDIQNAGAARASGYAASGNAYGGALSGIGNNMTSLAFLSQMKDANGKPLFG